MKLIIIAAIFAVGCTNYDDSYHPSEIGTTRALPEAGPCDYTVATQTVVDSQGYAANSPPPAPGCWAYTAAIVHDTLEDFWCCPTGGEK